MNQNKTVIITGALGFIGGHTAKLFKAAGWQVIGVDREHTIPEAASFVDILLIDDFVNVVPHVATPQVSAIVHCAGTSLVGPSMSNPGLYYNNNCAKTNSMMDELARNQWPGTLVFSSSAAVYGMPKIGSDIHEQDEKNPISPYGWSKLFCERIIEDHCRAHGLKGVALRYFNACGCDPAGMLGHVQDATHLIPRILSAYQNGRYFVINGDDYNTPDKTCIRDYLHVMDIAQAHLIAAEQGQSYNLGEFRAYNLGTGRGYSIKEVISACEKTLNNPINLSVGPRRAGDPDSLVANSDLFQKDTPWLPTHSNIETIVLTAWNWQKKLPLD